jgi:hypothetical protein
MGVVLGLIFVGVPCLAYMIISYTPKGKEWLERNGWL